MINYMMAYRFCKELEYKNKKKKKNKKNHHKTKKTNNPCFMVEKFSAAYNAEKG